VTKLTVAFRNFADASNYVKIILVHDFCGPGISVGKAIDYGLDGPGIESRWGEIFRACSDQPWGPPSLLYNGYRLFPGGKVRLGHAAEHSPPSSTDFMEK
jgi:hypothetical protein